jgi:ATP-binding cassette subfamily B protein
MNNDKIATAKQTAKLYLETSLTHKRYFFLALLNPLGSVVMGVGLPFFASKTLASIVAQDEAFTQNLILLIISVCTVIVFNRIGIVALMKLIAYSMQTLGERTFNALLARGVRYHTNNIGGKLMSDASDVIEGYSKLALAAFTNGASIVLTLIFGLAVVFTQSLQLGIFLFIIVGIMILWTVSSSKKRSSMRVSRHKATKAMIAHYSDSVVNAATAKIFAAEKIEFKNHAKLNSKLTSIRVEDWTWAVRNGNNRIGFLLISVVGLLVLLNYLADKDAGTIAAGIFAFTYTFTLILRLFVINTLTTEIEESLLRAGPMTLMLLEEPEVIDTADAQKLVVKSGAIDLQNVSFHYEDSSNNDKVFHDLNLSIKPGEKIGLVGPSGGGKTTMTRILLRFDDIQEGSIQIDHQDISLVTQQSLRSNIGYVPQEALLFHRSVFDNIAYGKYGATLKEVETAAKQANALDFILKLPDGFDTIVGERGVKLSGGQRQRVAIARAMLKNAPILLLDEATSALDSESEQYVQASLDTLMNNKTSIVIAHRLSTIQKMDRIIVLDEGRIVEEGSHAELLKKKNGLYARLWKHQSGGFLQD